MSNTLVSPLCTVRWPQLFTPSVYTPPGGTPDPADRGRYSVMLLLDPEKPDHADFIERMNAVAETLFEEEQNTKGKKLKKNSDLFSPFVSEEDDEGNETGLLIFKCAQKAGGVVKHGRRKGQDWEAKIIVLNHQGKPLVPEDGQELGNGTVLRVEVEPYVMAQQGLYRCFNRLKSAQVAAPTWYSRAGAASAFAGQEIDPETFEDAVEPTLGQGHNF